MAISLATVIMFSKYEADDSNVSNELKRVEVMLLSIDGFVNTYIEIGESLTGINFKELSDNGILLSNSAVTLGDTPNEAIFNFSNSQILWQLIPNKTDTSSYKVLVDFRKNSSLMSKGSFAENFIGKEYCQKILFADFDALLNKYDDGLSVEDFINDSASNQDGFLSCTVYK